MHTTTKPKAKKHKPRRYRPRPPFKPTPIEAENQRLRQELARLEFEYDFLRYVTLPYT